jgi:uncharacterized protein (TIGR03663 family)
MTSAGIVERRPGAPGQAAAARAQGGPRAWLARTPRAELVLWAALVLAALLVRVIALGDRPFHHDESQDAYFSWQFSRTGDYAYDPLLHGPLRFYLTATAYWIFGDSDFTARLAPALMGTLTVALPFGLRRLLGRGAAFAAGALLAFGPTALYFSRFAREDVYVGCLELALVVVAFRYLARPRGHQPAVLGALLALAFATKESTFITVFVMGSFFLVALARPRTRPLILRPLAVTGWAAWGWALAAFAGVFTALFTTFFTHPGGLWDGVYTGLDYWLGQHAVGRGGEPWFFYCVLLFGEEWPVLVLGAVGAVAVLRRPTLLGAFLIWDFLLSLAVYSWAGEKFAWLVLHPLLPLVLLAGLGLQAIWHARRRWAGRLGLALAAAALAYAGLASYWVNARHSADPRELLVSTQSSVEVRQVAREVLALGARRARAGERLQVTVDAAQGATFPYAWYFRHLSTGYVDLTAGQPVPDSDVIVMTEASRTRLLGQLGGYRGRRFAFRVWWVRDYGAMSVQGWWRWFTAREPWNATGGMPEWIYVKRGL